MSSIHKSIVCAMVVVTLVPACATERPGTELASRANAICSQGADAIAALGPPPETGGDLGTYAGRLAHVQASVVRRLAELDVGPDARRSFDLWIGRLELLVDRSSELSARTRVRGVVVAWPDISVEEAAIDAQDAASNLGFDECSRFGLP
jgi:hypothetical protein